MSVALAGLVYLQVSGLVGGSLDAAGSAGDTGQTAAGAGGDTLQTPAAGPSTGGGTPVARTGGS